MSNLAEKLGFPILADPLSQLRSGNIRFQNVIETYDTFLRDEASEGCISSGCHPPLWSHACVEAFASIVKKTASQEYISH